MATEFKPIDCTIDVVTPENIAFQYELAGPFRRLPAFVIDVVLRFAVWTGCIFLMALLGVFFGPAGGTLGVAIWLLLWFVMEWFYGGLLETFWNGQTVGKRLLGIRVLGVDGQPINGLQAVMRNILRLVDMMPVIPMAAFFGTEGPWALPTCLIGLTTPMLNHRFQRLGDLACGTMVVVEERGWLLSTVRLVDPRVAQLAAELPSRFQVGGRLSQAIAAYVERRPYLSQARLREIAQHLGDPLVRRLGLPSDTSHDLLLCALYSRTFVANDSASHEHSELSQQMQDPAGEGLTTAVVAKSPNLAALTGKGSRR
jgi:uncharacterized RDD family membrane protein YckC